MALHLQQFIYNHVKRICSWFFLLLLLCAITLSTSKIIIKINIMKSHILVSTHYFKKKKRYFEHTDNMHVQQNI